MVARLLNLLFACLLVFGFAFVVQYSEKPWPRIDGQPLVQQVSACQFINLRVGVENYQQALNALGLAPDLSTAVDLAINGPPRFNRRYDCFANLTDEEAENVRATKEYRKLQFEIQKHLNAFIAPSRGF